MKKGLIILATMFLPMSMLGSTELIYTWGYGNVMAEALQALKGLTSEADYLVKAAFAIAIFVFSISKALDSRSSPVFEIGKLILLYGVVQYFFLSPSNNVYVIHDEVTSKDYKVSNLPSGLGNTISLMSRLEKVILDGMEKHYSTPNSIAYSKAGLGFSLSAMMDIPTLRVSSVDADLQANIDYYVRSCFLNNLDSKFTRSTLKTSDNLLNDVLLESDGKLVYWLTNNKGTYSSSVISCGEAAKRIKNSFKDASEKGVSKMAQLNTIQNLQNTLKNFTKYEDDFRSATSLYFGQAGDARSQFQQIMIMNAIDDGIINTAKTLGLGADSVAANAAIADQTITTSMQSQGRLARTYLPLAKAYMTIIVVSVSWLMAIVSIIFGSYQHIKMFFTLCLTMVIWTPILSLINFFNDLNIQHTFALVNQDVSAFTYANYREVIQKVTENSNFLNYLVMMTPMLAFALAKGSEMGFVSIASSLSQQLAGASRAAAGFATQQALSTSTAITSPRGEEVYAREAGVDTYKFAQAHNGSVVAMAATGLAGGGMLNQTDTTAGGSVGTQNASGVVAANIKGLSANDVSSMEKSVEERASKSLDNLCSTAQGRQILANAAQEVGSSSTHTKGVGSTDAYTNALTKLNTATQTDSTTDQTTKTLQVSGGVKVQAGANTPSGKGSVVSAGVGGEAGVGYTYANSSIEASTNAKSTGDGRTYSDNFTLTNEEKAALMQNKAFMAALQTQDSTSMSKETREALQSIKSYGEVSSFSQNWGVDSSAYMVQNYMNANNCSMAEAMTALEQAAAQKDYATISKYAGVADNSGLTNTIPAATNNNNFDPSSVIGQHGANAAQALAAGKTGFAIDPKTGKEIVVNGSVAADFIGKGATVLANTDGKAGIPSGYVDLNHPAHKYTAMTNAGFWSSKLSQNPNLINTLPSLKTGLQNNNGSILQGF